MSRSGKGVVVVVLAALGVVAVAVAVLLAATSPALHDDCAPGYEACTAAAGGLVERLDCRLEMLHCRRQGPEHWAETQ